MMLLLNECLNYKGNFIINSYSNDKETIFLNN